MKLDYTIKAFKNVCGVKEVNKLCDKMTTQGYTLEKGDFVDGTYIFIKFNHKKGETTK